MNTLDTQRQIRLLEARLERLEKPDAPFPFQYAQPIVYQTDLTVNTDTALTAVALSAVFGIYVERVSVITRVSTTNTGANYWSIQVQGIDTAVTAASVVYSFDTSADSVNVYVAREGVSDTTPTNNSWFRINASKTGAPGTLRVAVTLYYRLYYV